MSIDETSVYLEEIIVRLPVALESKLGQLAALLGECVTKTHGGIAVRPSSASFLPLVSLHNDSDADLARVDFRLSSYRTISVAVRNITDEVRPHPSAYRHVPVEVLAQRFAVNGMQIRKVDHVGFNLPWFGASIHPAVADIRWELKAHCLLHDFPSGEPWKFILPGNRDEIDGFKSIDYRKTRRPKFEIVSFPKCSTPLVQIEVAVNMKYPQFSALFQEGLCDPSMKNVWVYIETGCNLDLCLVINESSRSDWSSYFEGHRVV